MPKTAFRIEAENKISDLTATLDKRYLDARFSFYEAEQALIKAKQDGIDIHDLEEQMPTLQRKVIRQYTNHAIFRLYHLAETGEGDPEYAVRHVREVLDGAKKAGLEYGPVEAEIPELRTIAYRKHCERKLSQIREYLQKEWSCETLLHPANLALGHAQHAGIDVRDLETEFKDLKKANSRQHVEFRITCLRNALKTDMAKHSYAEAKRVLESAKQLDVNVSDLEGELSLLERQMVS